MLGCMKTSSVSLQIRWFKSECGDSEQLCATEVWMEAQHWHVHRPRRQIKH